MARKKSNALKVLSTIGNAAANGAIGVIPDPTLRMAAQIGLNSLNGLVQGARGGQKKKKRNRKNKGVTQVSRALVSTSNAPTTFGTTIGGNYFRTENLGTDTIRCYGKEQFKCSIGQYTADPADNDDGFLETGVGSVVGSYMFNPLNLAANTVDSRLGKLAQTYKSYGWQSLKFDYVPTCGSAMPGQFVLACSWDPTQAVPSDAVDLLDFEDSISSVPWKPCSLVVKCPALGSKEDWSFNSLKSTDTATKRQNFQLQAMCKIWNIGNVWGTPTDWGSLVVEYVVDFYKPYLATDEITLILTMENRLGKLSREAFERVKSMVVVVDQQRTAEEGENEEVKGRLKLAENDSFPPISQDLRRDKSTLETCVKYRMLSTGKLVEENDKVVLVRPRRPPTLTSGDPNSNVKPK